jgi:hypothetical protein
MSYTQQQLSDFWWGPGGSSSNVQPGAYVTMGPDAVLDRQLWDSAWAAILAYVFGNRLFGFANFNYAAAGSNVFPGQGKGWRGPIIG